MLVLLRRMEGKLGVESALEEEEIEPCGGGKDIIIT